MTGSEIFLSPDTLNYFFEYDRIFCFQSELDDANVFTYGYAFPVLRKIDVPALHLLASSQGGLTTFVNEVAPVSHTEIRAKIAELYGLKPANIKLQEIDRSEHQFLEFPKEIDPEQNIIPFETGKAMSVTHAESTSLAKAFDDKKKQVRMLSRNVFVVPCQVKLGLFLDTNTLRGALEAGVKDEAECIQYIETSIADGQLHLDVNHQNQPSAATLAKAKEELYKIAAQLILNKIAGVVDPNQLPDYEATPAYDTTIGQTYLLEIAKDLGDQFVGIPLSVLVSKSSVPLPEPSRDQPDPIPVDPVIKSCRVSIDFKAADYGITKFKVRWGHQEVETKWPSFRPVDLQRGEGETSEVIVVETVFNDYKTNTTEFALAKAIAVPFEKSGLCRVSFDGAAVKDTFKSVKIAATYQPADQDLREEKETIHFPNRGTWQYTWDLRTLAPDLGGEISYRWEGVYDSRWKKNYKSGDLKTSETSILLQKK